MSAAVAAGLATDDKIVVGDVWQNWDSRLRPEGGGYIKVVEIREPIANDKIDQCDRLSDNRVWVQDCGPDGHVRRETKRGISARRFRECSTGYRLITRGS